MIQLLQRYLFAGISLASFVPAHGQCCPHTLRMNDSYGDGWNGGLLEVFLNEASIGTFTATGAGSSVNFMACTGDAIRLLYSPLEWEEENTYVLYDQWGGVVYADGPEPGQGVVYEGEIDCAVQPALGSGPCTALAIDTLACANVDNTGANGTGIDPGCATYQGGDVWYRMAVPPSGNVVVSTVATGSFGDTGLALWAGPDCFDRDLVGCDDDGGPGATSMLSANDLSIGDTLWIQVFGYSGGTGTFDLCVSAPGGIRVDSTELPIVLINTLGQEIPDEPKITALMEIKYNGPGTITYITDPSNVYSGRIGIERRGASSFGYPQRPYSLETRDLQGGDLDVPLLDMPAESDWVLVSNYNDRSLVRNQLAFHLFAGMGHYAPRTHLCEVLIDSVYKGIYLFGEKIKRDMGRVDIAKLTMQDNAGDELTGGYILQQNHWEESNSFQSNYSPIDHPGLDIHFLYEYPKPEEITQPQRTYIAAYVDSLETALYSNAFADTATGYRRYLDMHSFIAYFLVNELARSNDGFKKSVFYYKDKNSLGGKLKAGPVWDFDWAWKDIAECDLLDNTDGSGWAHHINDCPTDNYSNGWYIRLLQDSTFTRELQCAYQDFRTTLLDTTRIFHVIDSIGSRVQHAQVRHFQKWPILGISGPAPEVNPAATSYAAELDTLKAWITRRLVWLDANMPGLCTPIAGIAASTRAPGVQVLVDPHSAQVRFTSLEQGPFTLWVHDVLGRTVSQMAVPRGPTDVRWDAPGSGAYFYGFVTAQGMRYSGKFIVP